MRRGSWRKEREIERELLLDALRRLLRGGGVGLSAHASRCAVRSDSLVQLLGARVTLLALHAYSSAGSQASSFTGR